MVLRMRLATCNLLVGLVAMGRNGPNVLRLRFGVELTPMY